MKFTTALGAPAAAFFLAVFAQPAFARPQSGADKIYEANCALCHAADGSGSSATGKAMGAKNLASDEVQKQSDAQLTDAITNGKGKMPAFGKKLKPDNISALVIYVRALAKK